MICYNVWVASCPSEQEIHATDNPRPFESLDYGLGGNVGLVQLNLKSIRLSELYSEICHLIHITQCCAIYPYRDSIDVVKSHCRLFEPVRIGLDRLIETGYHGFIIYSLFPP